MKRILLVVFSGALFMAMKNKFLNPSRIVNNDDDSTKAKTVYHISLKSLDGKSNIDLASFKGKKILFVNTASECGYTYQYEGLEQLYKDKKDKLVIIGCPCNQFGFQEPGDSSKIREFCSKKFSVTFLLSEKLEVKGNQQHPLYKWLTQKTENGVLDTEVKWNFNKYLIGTDGKLIAYFPSKVKPNDSALLSLIDK
jgi:glutathione peroxidase